VKYGCTNNPNTLAYTWEDIGYIVSWHYVVFCPRFFADDVVSLATQTQNANNNPGMQTVMDYWKPVRARTMFHETYHWQYTVSIPRALDYGYTPQQVVALAANNDPNAVQNAESYAQAALAIYIQNQWGLAQPPQPAGAALYNLVETALDSPPDGWVAPVNPNSLNVNLTGDGVVQLSSAGAITVNTAL
jgi:hypothetical protein